jgi:predicted nucleic acid-binding protein
MVNSNKKINDYEDGLQYYSAFNAGCQMIITENVRDFFFSEIPIHTSKDFILNVL